MKRIIGVIMVLALLGFWNPCGYAEISGDLDPMVPVDPQATVTSDNSMNAMTGETSNVVSTASATVADEKKAGEKKVSEKKKKKSKKSSVKKSSSERDMASSDKKDNKSIFHKKDKKSGSRKKDNKSSSRKKDKKSGSEKSKTGETSSDPTLS